MQRTQLASGKQSRTVIVVAAVAVFVALAIVSADGGMDGVHPAFETLTPHG